MKKYPKVLADVAVLNDVLDYLYRQAEYAADHAADCKARLQQVAEGEVPDSWIQEKIAENQAKADAYLRMAERLVEQQTNLSVIRHYP